LKDGQEVTGFIYGKPEGVYFDWQTKRNFEDWAEGRRFKFYAHFLIPEGNTFLVKILTGPKRLLYAISDAKKEYGQGAMMKIVRAGSGKDDTRYAVYGKGNITENQKKAIAGLDLPDLKSSKNVVDEQSQLPYDEMNPPPLTDDDLPF
jgi:hypothetical protein